MLFQDFLDGGQPKPGAQETLHQHDDIAAVSRPTAGFFEGQGHMVVSAAFAATNAGKVGIHGKSVTRQGQKALMNGGGFLPLFTVLPLCKASYAPALLFLGHQVPKYKHHAGIFIQAAGPQVGLQHLEVDKRLAALLEHLEGVQQ